MGDPKGFLTLRRAGPSRQPVDSRVRHWGEFYTALPEAEVRAQGARCMDCGVPFCQGDTGCPVRNVVPTWNDLVYHGRWREALETLHTTNNFPELTGRLCPAPCESACVLGLVDEPVAIRNIEQSIADRGFDEGWVRPQRPRAESGRRVAVVGSGPAGLAAAQQLRRAGHRVDVYERDRRPGGLLRYGIPDFKLDKHVLDRRLDQLEAEGVVFHTGVDVGVDVDAGALRREHDVVLIATGARVARELPVPGRELRGVHLAMDFLAQQNRRLGGEHLSPGEEISARDKHVVIIGGGDTGSDCAGTCIRQGAASVRQFELTPQPPAERANSTPWPLWPMQLRTSHAHEEGCEREWCVSTTAFGGKEGRVHELHAVHVAMESDTHGRTRFTPVDGSAFTMRADLVLLAMGFTGADPQLASAFEAPLSPRGAFAVEHEHRTNVPGLYVAGDARRGASLIVWAIREGRDAAAQIDAELSLV
jgi:glutamate synthase (NADPH) small chain